MDPDVARARGAVRVGRLGSTEVLVSGSCLAVVGLIAVAFAPRAERLVPGLGATAYVVGALVGVLVYAAALAHEAAHAAVARRHGHPVPAIVLSMAGGRTRVDGESATPVEEAVTAVVGPLASLALGLVGLGARLTVDDGVLALTLEALVLANLVIGVLDLVPAPPLDGGRVVKAVAWQLAGSPRRGAIAAAWVGRGVAGVLLLVPLLVVAPLAGREPRVVDYVVCVGLALLLWTTATNDLTVNRMRLRLAGIDLASVARPPLTVAPETSLAEALSLADAQDAGGIVVVDPAGRALGLVETPTADDVARGAVRSVASHLDDGLSLPVDVTGDELLAAVRRRPAPAYLLVDPAGAPLGVLSLRDLDHVVRLRRR
ncbi:site-2 protease family protein [Nocardioides rubriscoriae]|uniref:site-2 protease family protein n=1 Tax=Nocardioides rubriscoriae TaxID=642762 RepID=UPI0011E05C9E|nr:site-2 protease family protein [Nocardioides rubriscoriae]